MQIDFHHGTTYVIARYAGFGHREAEIIAYCSQYVDDATNKGEVFFDNGALYSRISSAHKILDYRNFAKLANHQVWIPFHFLPGNGLKKPGENPEGSFIEKIICRPDSPVARDMISECIKQRDNFHGLHRLGITMHVYADTWAHQGFAGVCHEVNDIRALDDNDQPDPGFLGRLKDYFGDTFDDVTSSFTGDALPLGHGAALSCPDKPYLKWNYKDHSGQKITRDNPTEFLAAAQAMCKAMQQFRVGNPEADVSGLPDEGKDKIKYLITKITSEEGDSRHKEWLNYIKGGYFDFPPVKINYQPKGLHSWKHEALGTRRIHDKKNQIFPYNQTFLGSDWKYFHDALIAHRFTVIRKILPKYGICAS